MSKPEHADALVIGAGASGAIQRVLSQNFQRAESGQKD
jgi:cation diffusion facilitator CzcD-associated flavoprotein CzcO